MKIFALIFFGFLLIVSHVDARSIKGGNENNDKTNLVGINMVTYQGAYQTCPTESNFDYYHKKHWTLLRTPISISILQPIPMGALDPTYLTCLDNVAGWAAERGIKLILDLHAGAGSRTDAQFADFWSKVATHFVGHAGIVGYDLENEPGGNAFDNDPTKWFDRAQAAIDAIRLVDNDVKIYLESVHWSSAWLWQQWAEYALAVNDPQNKIVYSAHAYPDRDSSGSHYVWDEEVAAGDILDPDGCTPSVNCAPLDTNILIKRYKPFVTWCRKNNKNCHIGETAVGKDDPNWFVTLDKGLEYLTKNNIEVTYWAGGPSWGEYPYTAEPKTNGEDREQVAVLDKYTGVHEANNIFITGPQRGVEDVESTDFTMSYNGEIKRNFRMTPTTSGTGVFSPSYIDCVVGFNCVGDFTFTADNSEINILSVTNNGSVGTPLDFGYSTITDGFSNGSGFLPVNAFSLRKVYGPYLGPAIRLRRASDDAERDFGFVDNQLNSSVDTTAIQQWGGHYDLYVVKWYDQGPKKYDAKPSFVDRTATPADQPKFVLNCVNGKPCIHFNGANAMEATSPINGKTGQSLLWVYKPTTHLGQPLVTWRFINGQHMIYSNEAKDRYRVLPYSGSSPTPTVVDLRLYSQDNGWTASGVSWVKNTTDGASVFKNAVKVGKRNTGDYTLVYPNRTNLQLGFTYIGGGYFNYFNGDVAELIVYDSNLADTQVEYIQDEQVSYYGIPSFDTWTWPTPTLEQNSGAANAAPWMGINQGGIGFGTNFDSLPVAAGQSYYASRGFNITRFPVAWEMIQQNLCTGDTTLDSAEMAKLDQAVTDVTSSGMDILIDLHNYGKYNYTYNGRTCASPPDSGSTSGNITETTTGGYFANVWGQLAARYKTNPKVKFDLMNEPVGKAASLQAPKFQAAIDAIRTAGSTQHIIVEWGPGYASCQDFAANGGPAMLGLSDPENKLVASCHNYLRSGSSADSYCVDCDDTATQGKGLSIVSSATTYAKANNIKLFLGEIGIGHTPSSYSEGKVVFDYIANNLDTGTGGWVGWTAWGAGRDWPEAYLIKIEPLSFNSPVADRPNMRFLSTYATGGTWPSAVGTWPNNVQFP